MSKLIKRGKFALVVSLTISTVVWSIGLAAFTPTVFAASAGDLIQQEGSASVYYVGADGKRYVFPNQATFDSWYGSDATVTTVSSDELLGLELGGNVVARAGRLVQVVTNDTPWMVADAKVYALSNNGTIQHIDSADTAAALFGSDWETRIIPVPEQLFSNYTVGDQLTSSSTIPDGFLVTDGTDTYLIDGGQKRAISAEGFTANNYKDSDKITVSDLSAYADGAAISGAESDLTNVAGGASTGTVVAGGLTVAVASSTPASQSIPSNATGVVFSKVNFTAGSDADATITSLTVNRSGVGPYDDISKVYIYDGDTRLTSGKTINSSTNDTVFSNLSITVPAGTTKTLSIVGDIGSTKSGNHALGIKSADDVVTSGATVSGTFPATGNTMSLSTTSVGLTDVESNGSSYTTKIGSTDVEVANFSVHVNSTEDAEFKGITLYNSGRDIFDNLKLYRGSDLLAEGVESGNYFIFTLDTPYSIERSQSASFTVRGDVSGRNNDTGTLYVRYDTDVEVVGKTYGYNLAPTVGQGSNANTSYIEEQDSDASSTTANTTTAEAGQLTVAVNGPVAGDVPENTNDVELLNFSLTSATNIDVEKASISLSTDSTDALVAADVENLELVCGGTAVAEWASPTIGTNSSTDIWQITAGETLDCTVRIDFTSNPDGSENITATLLDLTSSSNWTLKDSDTGDTITDVVPSGNIAGNEMTVQTASLALSLGSVPASGTTYVKGTSDVPLAGFVFTAGNASDVKITSIKLTAYADDDTDTFGDTDDKNQSSNAEDVIGSVTIYDGDTVIAGPKALTVGTSDVSVTFNSLNWTIPAGASKLLTAKVNISTTAPLGGDNDYIALAIASTSDVSAEYGSGTAITPSGTPNTTPSVYQTVASSGTLTMAAHADTPDAGLLVAGSQGVEFTKVKFTATNEAFVIDKLRVVNDGYGSYGDDEFTAVILEYTNSSGSTETKSGIFVAGNSDFTDLDIYVPKDDDATLTIKANLNTTAGGADNAAAPSLKVDFDTNFRATGQGSSTVVTSAGSADVDGNAMTIYESIPTIAFTSDTVKTDTLIPSTNTLVGKINITADAGEDITFDSTDELTVQFAMSGGSAGTANVVLKDADGNTLDTQTIADTTASSAEETFTFATNSLTVAKGTTQTVYVYMDTTNFNTIGDTVQIWLDDTAGDIEWEIDDGGTSYEHGDIIFKGELYGTSFVKP
jgi:hypothetical protein